MQAGTLRVRPTSTVLRVVFFSGKTRFNTGAQLRRCRCCKGSACSGVFTFAVGCSFQRSACCCCDMGAAAPRAEKAPTGGDGETVGEVARTSVATTYAVQVDAAAGKDGVTMRDVHPPQKLTDAEFLQRYEDALETVGKAATPAQLASACNAVPDHVLNRLSPAQIRRAGLCAPRDRSQPHGGRGPARAGRHIR